MTSGHDARQMVPMNRLTAYILVASGCLAACASPTPKSCEGASDIAIIFSKKSTATMDTSGGKRACRVTKHRSRNNCNACLIIKQACLDSAERFFVFQKLIAGVAIIAGFCVKYSIITSR